MNKKYLFAAVLALASVPAFAQSGDYLSIKEIADITGMEPREVRMMVGASSTDPLYLTAYTRISREWDEAVKANGLRLVNVRGGDGRIAVRVLRPSDKVS